MNDKPRHILERFREESRTLTRLIEEDPEFLALCEDYDACVKALRHWAQSKEGEAKTRVNEYRTLVQELEEEITQALVALKSRRLD
jgi:hypothetical protein